MDYQAILARARELRRPLTPQEAKLWQRLRRKQLYGLEFRRQHPMFRFILDFFCYKHGLDVINKIGFSRRDRRPPTAAKPLLFSGLPSAVERRKTLVKSKEYTLLKASINKPIQSYKKV